MPRSAELPSEASVFKPVWSAANHYFAEIACCSGRNT
jgi:hypothetical protein